MSEFEIRIPARKKQPATDKDNPVVKVSPEWCDRKYNNNYSNRAYKAASKKHKKVEQIKDGVVIKIWNSLSEIGRKCGISIGNISECCNGKRETAGGYSWRFEEVL